MDYSDRRLDHFPYQAHLILIFAFSLVLSGCATPARQTEELLSSPASAPIQHLIPQVPFFAQTEGHCGPATLAMALKWAGKPVSPESLAPQVYTPGSKGSFQTDMISAARRQGLMAVPIEGLRSLLTEISSNHPVIVFENLSVSWLPQWHYALVFGYDLNKPEVILHSGPEQDKHWDLRKFERSWMLGDYWGLVVLPPTEIAVSAGELANLASAAALEQLGHAESALAAYTRIERQWPNSLGALIGLGNLSYQQKNYQESVRFLKKAVEYHPQSAIAKHNLATAQKALAGSTQGTRRR